MYQKQGVSADYREAESSFINTRKRRGKRDSMKAKSRKVPGYTVFEFRIMSMFYVIKKTTKYFN